MKHLALLAAAAGSMAVFAVPAQAATLPAAPAPISASFHDNASPFGHVAAYGDDDWRDRRDRRRWRDRDRDWDDRRWDERRRDDRRWEGRRGDTWRDDDGRWRCRRSDGTTGLVVGAVGGALLGRTVDRWGDRSAGTLIGAIGGGLLGREIDRGENRCR